LGDISRHRDIFLNTRAVTPPALLAKCKLSAADLTYLELGNYLTDVSQFRDPVFYIFSKQRVWREFVLPKAADKVLALRILSALAGYVALAASQTVKELTSGTTADIAKYTGYGLAGLGTGLAALPSLFSTDTLAGVFGADDWIDKMLGTPFEKLIGDPLKRDAKHYGFVGQFFQYFTEGITHLLFASDITNRVKGSWGSIDPIPKDRVEAIFSEFFTQYFPHEHTDQPPYIWDASQRPRHPDWYGPSRRQQTLVEKEIGVMNAVDNHYIQYLSERLIDLEQDWRAIKPADQPGRQRWLVQVGKVLHGVEDWYFHSNVVELFRLRSHKPPQGTAETGEEFLKRFVKEIGEKDIEFKEAAPVEKLRLQRRLFRRLRFPVYKSGDKQHSGGVIDNSHPSTLSLHHAYPAFPSQQDTTNTILHALENLEVKAFHSTGGHGLDTFLEKLPWAPCLPLKLGAARGGEGEKLLDEKARARGTTRINVLRIRSLPDGPERDKAFAAMLDVLREWLPLVPTLLVETERQRLVANVAPEDWPIGAPTPEQLKPGGEEEMDLQLGRHAKALERRKDEDGITENNYERAARYLVDCGFLNAAGQQALVKAFAIDSQSQKLLKGAPGAGGFLMKFGLDLQRALDEGDAAVEKLNRSNASVFNPDSDNTAFNEIIGSHSLMSKDTLTSAPFFSDAKVLASVASSAVFHILLEQVNRPASAGKLPWKTILHHFIRFPLVTDGWERRAIDFYRDPKNNKRIPAFTDIPELARVAEAARRASDAKTPYQPGKKDTELKEMYTRLEKEVSRYRYP
jgi:hypothetical protein